jgi:hypothetical protein
MVADAQHITDGTGSETSIYYTIILLVPLMPYIHLIDHK